jgi:hypothetical protein
MAAKVIACNGTTSFSFLGVAEEACAITPTGNALSELARGLMTTKSDPGRPEK